MKNKPITKKQVQNLRLGFTVTGEHPNRKQRRDEALRTVRIMRNGKEVRIRVPNSSKGWPERRAFKRQQVKQSKTQTK